MVFLHICAPLFVHLQSHRSRGRCNLRGQLRTFKLMYNRVSDPGIFVFFQLQAGSSVIVWPDWAIYWTLGKFLKPLATINLSKSPAFLGNFCKGVKIYQFSSEIIFRQLLLTFDNFLLVTLLSYPIGLN